MISPGVFLGSIVSLFIGALFHLWRGGDAGRLIVYLILSFAGFWIGHYSGPWFNFSFWAIGVVNFGPALLGSGLFLGMGQWLTLVDLENSD